MATSQIDGNAVTRYQGRINGTFDLDDDTDNFQKGDIVMAVVVLHAKSLLFDDDTKGDCIGTYRFVVKDFALVSDEVMRKNLFHHLPHLEPAPQLPFPVRIGLAGARGAVVGDDDPSVALMVPEYEDTVVSPAEDLREDDILAHDSEDGEVFSPLTESRERARLMGSASDPILQRFLSGG